MTARDWTTVSRPSSNRLRFRRLRLLVIDGPNAGRRVAFSTDTVRVGALPSNDLVLDDRGVSGLHFEVDVMARGVRLRDPGSTNGTRVNGVRVVDAYLSEGAHIFVGDSVIRLETIAGDDELALPDVHAFGPLVGASAAMRELYSRIERLAASTAPVLIIGETGTGKELVARALHAIRSGGDAPFVPVTCPAMPSELIESELFGYERGAFTGAERTVIGAFERAEDGTVLLDEIGDMPIALQPKLLGVLERRSVRRLGSGVERPVRARVIAATNRDIPGAVAAGAFRADLYYRLGVGRLRIPPLRERPEDIPLLVEHFARSLPGSPPITREMMATLQNHPWPGNVRELRNAVERIALLGSPALADHCIDTPGQVGSGARIAVDLDAPYATARDELLATFRRMFVERALERTRGNVAEAARQAGVDRMTLYRILREGGVR